nr:hypothetical protein BaRGS_012651 [Batillaria attramentaria]
MELTIADLQFEDAGDYECWATNIHSQTRVRRVISVRVESSPYWLQEPQDVEIEVGGTAEFNCLADAVPEPQYFWFVNGVPLYDVTDSRITADRFNRSRPDRIVFSNVTREDLMVLQCNATNKHGYVWGDVYLNVSEVESWTVSDAIAGVENFLNQTTFMTNQTVVENVVQDLSQVMDVPTSQLRQDNVGQRIQRMNTPSKILVSLCVALALSDLVFVVGMQDYTLKHPAACKSSKDKICWLRGTAFYAAFVGPVCLILLLNLVSFVLVLRVILGLTDKQETSQAAQKLRRAIGVVVLLGLTWVFGLLSIEDTSQIVFNYLFAVFNSLQGLFIFLFYCVFNTNTRAIWQRCFRTCFSEDSACP